MVSGTTSQKVDPSQATTIIKPRPGWHLIDLRELWLHRGLLYFLTWRDIKVRYKQTVVGVLWALLQPFLKLVVFSVIFGIVAKIDSQGYPYPIFLYAALLPWQFFSVALTTSSGSVVASAGLITKVYFPRLIIPMASVGACLVDFGISFTLLIGLMLYYGVAPTVNILMVVPLVIFTIFTALGVGTLLSALNVAYRDFRYVVPFGVNLWMFVTPVLYSREAFEDWQRVLALNPMAGIVDAYRAAVLGKPFDWDGLAISMAVAVGLFLVGMLYFRRLERQFADIV